MTIITPTSTHIFFQSINNRVKKQMNISPTKIVPTDNDFIILKYLK